MFKPVSEYYPSLNAAEFCASGALHFFGTVIAYY